MTAYNSVRFRVKPGKDDDFLRLQKESISEPMPGLIELAIVKTGDRSYCFIGKWRSFDDIVAARPQMIASLDKVRDVLEDLGRGLGITDPVSGEAVLELHP